MAQRNFLILLAVVALGVWWFTRDQTPAKETDTKTTTTTIEKTETPTSSKKTQETKEEADDVESKEETGGGNDLGLTGTFTHKAYGYIVLLPSSWNWNGTQVHTLVLSSQKISANSEPLTKNNLKILRSDQPTPEGDVVEKSLGSAGGSEFKAVYLKDHNYPEIVREILASFAVKNTAAVTL